MIREWIQKTHLNTLAPLPSWPAPLVLNRTAFMIGETNLRICGNARLKRLPSASSAQRCPKVAYDLPRNAEAALLPGPSRMRCFARPCERPTCGLFLLVAQMRGRPHIADIYGEVHQDRRVSCALSDGMAERVQLLANLRGMSDSGLVRALLEKEVMESSVGVPTAHLRTVIHQVKRKI